MQFREAWLRKLVNLNVDNQTLANQLSMDGLIGAISIVCMSCYAYF